MKKIKIVLIIIFVLIFLFYFLLNYVNDDYLDELTDEIYSNVSINENIEYVNKYKYSYVVMTKEKIYVFNDKYEMILEDDKKNITDDSLKYDIVYYQGKLLYEKINYSKNYLTYQYYDVYTNFLIDEIKIRR